MQKLVMHPERTTFDYAVNNAMSQGWKVVPGTLVIAHAGIPGSEYTVTGPYRQSSGPEFRTMFAVVIEKENTPCSENPDTDTSSSARHGS